MMIEEFRIANTWIAFTNFQLRGVTNFFNKTSSNSADLMAPSHQVNMLLNAFI